jgi:hypothetical protein
VVGETGTELTGDVDSTGQAAANALSALGSVRDLLAAYTFLGM